VMDNSTKLYSIVNITVNDVADRRNKVTISSNFRHYKNRHVCVMDFMLISTLHVGSAAQDHIRFYIYGCFPYSWFEFAVRFVIHFWLKTKFSSTLTFIASKTKNTKAINMG